MHSCPLNLTCRHFIFLRRPSVLKVWVAGWPRGCPLSAMGGCSHGYYTTYTTATTLLTAGSAHIYTHTADSTLYSSDLTIELKDSCNYLHPSLCFFHPLLPPTHPPFHTHTHLPPRHDIYPYFALTPSKLLCELSSDMEIMVSIIVEYDFIFPLVTDNVLK